MILYWRNVCETKKCKRNTFLFTKSFYLAKLCLSSCTFHHSTKLLCAICVWVIWRCKNNSKMLVALYSNRKGKNQVVQKHLENNNRQQRGKTWKRQKCYYYFCVDSVVLWNVTLHYRVCQFLLLLLNGKRSKNYLKLSTGFLSTVQKLSIGEAF